MNRQRLHKAFNKFWQRGEASQWTYGLMGKIKGGVPVFDVVGRAGYVYVRIRNQNGAQTSPPARNDPGVAHSAGLGVRMRMEGTTLVIDSEVRREDLATTPAPPGSGVGTHIHDTRYFTEAEHISVSAGAADAGKAIILNASGEVDASMLPSTVLTDTDDLPEGTTNLYYTDERAQDAVGLMIDDTATVALAYVDATPALTATVIDDSITFAKMQNIATDSLIGRDTAGSGDPETITLGASLSMTGAQVLQRAALTGDVTAAANSNTTAIANNAVLTAMIADAQVTLAKMANLAADTMIGRANGAGTGVPQALTATQVIAILQSGLDARYGQLAAANTWTLLQTFSSGILSATVDGSIAANGDLTLQGTTHATRTTSYVILQPTAGLVGISESTPIEKLHVAGNIIVPNGSFYKGMMLDATPIRVFGLGADDIAYFGGIDAGVTEVRFRTAALNRMTIDASGDVGIGTLTPLGKLDIRDGTGGHIPIISKTGVVGSEVELLPAGTALTSCKFDGIAKGSSGTVLDATVTGTLRTPGAGSVTQVISVITMKLYSTGQLVVFRSSGAETWVISLDLIWM